MLNQAQNQAAREAAADFTTEATAYQALLAQHQLPLSVDLDKLTSIYRGRLFEQLLAADTGLQARYELARTTDGKKRIQADTMAGIDLRGHELPDTLEQAIASLERAWRAVPMLNDVPNRPLDWLAANYSFDYGRLLDSHTMRWEGKEAAVTYFTQLGQVLTGWRDLMRRLRRNVGTLDNAMSELGYYFPNQFEDGQPIVVDEQKLYTQLRLNPELLDLLADLPALPTDLLLLDEDEWPEEKAA